MLLKELRPNLVNLRTTISPCGVTHFQTSDYLPTPILPITSFTIPLFIKV
jgi:hypothetical protein